MKKKVTTSITTTNIFDHVAKTSVSKPIRQCSPDDLKLVMSSAIHGALKRYHGHPVTEALLAQIKGEIEKAVHEALPIGVEISGSPTLSLVNGRLSVEWPINLERVPFEKGKIEDTAVRKKEEDDAAAFIKELKEL